MPCKTDGLELGCGADFGMWLVLRTRAGLSEAYVRVHSQPNMALELVYGDDFTYFYL